MTAARKRAKAVWATPEILRERDPEHAQAERDRGQG